MMKKNNEEEKIIVERAPRRWAEGIFAETELGDRRRTQRLINIASNVVASPGESFVTSCKGNSAEVEGTYRWLENEAISHEAIIAAGCQSSDKWIEKTEGDILAASDTSTIICPHSLREKLGPLSHGSKGGSGKRGLLVHSTVFQSVRTGESLGLGDQIYWQRNDKEQGKKHKRKQREYEQKESFKWEYSIARIVERFSKYLKRIIFVSDRESDIYELLMYLLGNGLRYVIRASWNRKIAESEQGLIEKVSTTPVKGEILLNIPQKGGRVQRRARVELRSCTLELLPPSKDESLPPLKLNVVSAQELAEDDPMRWLLLTSEPIETLDEILYVLRCYGLRWKVEEFHKLWKSGGTNVEGLRLQSPAGLIKAATVLAYVAVRLSQLRDEAEPELRNERTEIIILTDLTKSGTNGNKRVASKVELAPERRCTSVLTDLEWQVLWLSVEEGKPLPPKVPGRLWAYRAIGRLAGWNDSKRTGRIGLKAFWKGYWLLQQRVNAVALAQQYGFIG